MSRIIRLSLNFLQCYFTCGMRGLGKIFPSLHTTRLTICQGEPGFWIFLQRYFIWLSLDWLCDLVRVSEIRRNVSWLVMLFYLLHMCFLLLKLILTLGLCKVFSFLAHKPVWRNVEENQVCVWTSCSCIRAFSKVFFLLAHDSFVEISRRTRLCLKLLAALFYLVLSSLVTWFGACQWNLAKCFLIGYGILLVAYVLSLSEIGIGLCKAFFLSCTPRVWRNVGENQLLSLDWLHDLVCASEICNGLRILQSQVVWFAPWWRVMRNWRRLELWRLVRGISATMSGVLNVAANPLKIHKQMLLFCSER